MTVLLSVPVLAAAFANAGPVVTSGLSPWDHGGTEILTAPTIMPGQTPISYTGTFTREREMFGYHPRFMPGFMTFGPNNRPYIVRELTPGDTFTENGGHFDTHANVDDVYIQTLDNEGNWIVYKATDIFKNCDVSDPGQLYEGLFQRHLVSFDEEGGVYFTTRRAGSSNNTLFYSKDGLANWSSFPVSRFSLMPLWDTFNETEKLNNPFLDVYYDDQDLYLTSLTKNVQNDISIGSRVQVGDDASVGPNDRHCANSSVTVGNKTHIVYLDAVNYSSSASLGVDHYYVCYDHATVQSTAPKLIGWTQGLDFTEGLPDTHNSPVIAVDSKGALHVVMGSHGNPMKYTASSDGGQTWSPPEVLAGSLTYPTLVVDAHDTLHLVYRASEDWGDGTGFKYRLCYMRKQSGTDWQVMGDLVDPYRSSLTTTASAYGNYYHKLVIDRASRLYITYSYGIVAGNLDANEAALYTAKWPDEDDPYVKVYAHDPVTIVSKDGGNIWTIAETSDFIEGIGATTSPVAGPVAYYSFDDAANLRADNSGYGNNLGSYVNDDPDAVAGQVGGAADFNGTTDSLDVVVSSTNPPIYPDGSFTAVCWAKPDVTNAGMYLTFPAARKGGFGIVTDGSPATWRFYCYGLNESGGALLGGNINSGVALTAGQYDHLALSYQALGSDGGTQGNYTGILTVYVNGAQVASSAGIIYGPNEFRFGLGSRISVGNYFDGSVDEFAVFDRVLSSDKIGQLYTGPRTPMTLGLSVTGDLSGDGKVDIDDFLILAENWLAGK